MKSESTLERIGIVSAEIEILDAAHAQFYQEMGYTGVCKINGRIVGIMQFIHTWGLCVGLDETGYVCRYCYHTMQEAAQGLAEWIRDGGDEPPKGYITRKP